MYSRSSQGRSLIAVSLVALMLTTSCTVNLNFGPEEPLAHVVIVWLKEPGNADHRAQIIDASRRLKSIDGVKKVTVGQSIPSDRDVVDDSFDIGLYVELESLKALDAYATDPLHLTILKNDIAPLTERYTVYDFEIDR